MRMLEEVYRSAIVEPVYRALTRGEISRETQFSQARSHLEVIARFLYGHTIDDLEADAVVAVDGVRPQPETNLFRKPANRGQGGAR